MPVRLVLVALAAGVALPLALSAQVPTFRGRADLARLDVVVIDNKTQKPLTGLTAKDFSIFEDGVPQVISAFSTETGGAASAATTATGSPETSPNRRVFLFIIGRGHLEGPVHPFEGLARFLRERLRPGDLAAVMAFNRVTPFTTEYEHLAAIVDEVKARRDSIVFELQTSDRRADVSETIQAHIDALFSRPPSGLSSVRNVLTMLLGTREFRANDNTWRPWNKIVINEELLKIYAGIDYLRSVEGEKHLVCLTLGLTAPATFQNGPVGLRLDSKEDDTRLARRATDAQVALDLIHTYGTDKDAFVIMASQRASELSGGMFTSLRTAESQLTRIDEATRARYVLGYASTNPKLDGKYRNVSVKVNRKNVTVIFPHGYTAQPDAPPLPLREIVTRQRLRDAVATDVSQDDIKIQATASVITDAATNTHRLKVDLKIDPANLSLKLADGKRQGVIDLLIVCGDMKQKAIGSLNQQMTLGLDDAHYQQALATGIPYTATVPVNGTPALVKVLVYDYDKDLLGATTVKLR